MLLESLERDADLSPATRRRRGRRPPAAPGQPPRGRGVVPRPSRDRGAPGAGTGRHQRAAAHGHHRARQHDVARSAVPQPARVGAVAAVPAADARERGHRSAPAAARAARTTQLPAELQGDAPLRRRRDDGGHRAARHGVPRAAVHASGLRLPRLVARRRHDGRRYEYHRRVVKLLRVATSAATCGCSRRRTTTSTSRRSSSAYPGRAVRHDAPRPGEVGAVVGEHRVDHLPEPRRANATCTDSVGRCPNTSVIGVEHAIAARARLGEDRFLDVHHRELDRRPDGHRAARLRVPRPRARARRSSRRSLDWQRTQPLGRARARTTTPPSSSA